MTPQQTPTMASTRALSGTASVPATNPPTSSAAAALADEPAKNTAPPPSSQGGGAGQGTDSMDGGTTMPDFGYGSAQDDEEIAKQLTNLGAMEI